MAKTQNERFVWENEQYYIVFYILYTTMSKWSECAHTSGVWRVCVRALAHAAFTRGVGVHAWTEGGLSEAWCWRDRHSYIHTITYFSGVAWTGLGICIEAIRLADASVGAWKLRQHHASDIALRQAWRRRPVWMQREPERAHTHVTHRMCVRTQITWTWLVQEVKNDINTVVFSHKSLVSCLGHQCVVTMGKMFNLDSLCMFLFPLIETVTYTCHYMTDQTRTVWPKNIKIGSTEEKKTPTSWMPLG